jgi:hypothetical protein
MSSHDEDLLQVAYGVISPEIAIELVREALDCDMSHPDKFVKLLVILSDMTHDNDLQLALHYLIRATYESSIAHSMAIDEYEARVREGQEPSREATKKYQKRRAKEEREFETGKKEKQKRKKR